jgi:ATP phosphoribosyltransferase regulatory subunit
MSGTAKLPAAGTSAGQKLHAHFLRAGFVAAELPVLQPAEAFFELSGEDIRRRLFLTSDEDGAELCLRPEFTIPAARAYLASPARDQRQDAVFFGPVFRHRVGECGEFTQVGVESFGRTDIEAADADILAETIAAIRTEIGGDKLAITVGDQGLFAALLDGLSLDGATHRRIALAFSEGRLAALLDPAREKREGEVRGLARYSGVLDALKGADPQEAKAFVKDLLSMAGITATGGRSAEDIAGRFLERARSEASTLDAEKAGVLRRFLALSGGPDQVTSGLRALAKDAGLDLAKALERFENRIGFFEARGITLSDITAKAGFARAMDYYSGFVFEVSRVGAPRPLAAGGRYDRLFERLGTPTPGIGAAIWVDRLAGDKT